MAINLAGRKPKWIRPISGRLIVLGAALIVLLSGSILFGFHYRYGRQEARKTSQQTATVASDAAVSNRATVEHDSLSGLPVTPSAQPAPAATIPAGSPGVVTYPGLPYPAAQPVYYQAPIAAPITPLPDPGEQQQQIAAARVRQREEEAIEAPTGAQNSASPVTAETVPPVPDPAALAGMFPQQGQAPQSRIVEAQSGYAGQNAQAEKRHFQEGGELPADDYLKTTRTPPLSRWVIQRGTVIPAALPSKLVSDLPGDLIAEVVRDVYDSPTQKYIEIPAGSRLVGEYNSSVSYAQNRVQVAWTAIYFPDGSYIDLDRMPTHAADGAVGLRDQVDNHWKRTIGGILLSSLLSAGLQVSQNRTNGSVLQYPSTGQEIAAAVGTQASELGQQITNRNLNVQPRLKIRPGEIFAVSVKKDIVFPGPYEPMELK